MRRDYHSYDQADVGHPGFNVPRLLHPAQSCPYCTRGWEAATQSLTESAQNNASFVPQSPETAVIYQVRILSSLSKQELPSIPLLCWNFLTFVTRGWVSILTQVQQLSAAVSVVNALHEDCSMKKEIGLQAFKPFSADERRRSNMLIQRLWIGASISSWAVLNQAENRWYSQCWSLSTIKKVGKQLLSQIFRFSKSHPSCSSLVHRLENLSSHRSLGNARSADFLHAFFDGTVDVTLQLPLLYSTCSAINKLKRVITGPPWLLFCLTYEQMMAVKQFLPSVTSSGGKNKQMPYDIPLRQYWKSL